MALALTRVTVTAQDRSVELLLPGDQPLAALMPRITELTGVSGAVPDGARTVLNRIGGPALSPQASLRDQHVADGEWLLLTTVEEALPEPIVYDVADAGEDLMPAVRRWSDRRVHVVAAVVVGTLALLGALALLASHTPAAALPAAGALGLLACAAVAWRPWDRGDVAPALAPVPLLALGLALLTAPPAPLTAVLALAAALVLTLVAVTVSTRMPRAAVAVLLTAALLVGCWALCWWLAPAPHLAALVAGSVTLVLLGALPRWAVGLSGLDSMDRNLQGSGTLRRADVLRVLTLAHRSLTASLLCLALSLGAAGVVVLRSGVADGWTLSTLTLWTAVVALRVRHFPLALQRILLGLAALLLWAVTLVTLGRLVGQSWMLAAAAGVLLLTAVALLAAPWLRPAAHVAARLRILGDRAESVAALAVIPVVVGAFGLYGTLLTTFQS